MNRNKTSKNKKDFRQQGKSSQQQTAQKGKAEKKQASFKSLPVMLYAIGALLIAIFSIFIYGDVFVRAEQDSFISGNAVLMRQMTDQPLGWLYLTSRYALTLFHSKWLGGISMVVVLTACVWLFNYALQIPTRWKACSFLLPWALMAWILFQGFNLYYKAEPSRHILIVLVLFTVLSVFAAIRHAIPSTPRKEGNRFWPTFIAAIIAIAGCIASCALNNYTTVRISFCVLSLSFAIALYIFLRTPHNAVETKGIRTFVIANVLQVAMFAGVTAAALNLNENEIVTCRMQLNMQKGDWEAMIEDGISVSRPTRSVAAYYAIALEQTDQLIERLFDLPFDYPEVRLNEFSKNDEYGLLLPDCNFYAGLINSAYHESFEQVVVNGLRLWQLKRMALSALLNDEHLLAEKYMKLIGENPFEQEFVDTYKPWIERVNIIHEYADIRGLELGLNKRMAVKPEETKSIREKYDKFNEKYGELADSKVLKDLAHILTLNPREERFEQMYRKPTFLGYNMGLSEGTDATLFTSVAATLYSKDLVAFIPRAYVFLQKGWNLPPCMQQAIFIYSLSHPQDKVLETFNNLNRYVENDFQAFAQDAAPYTNDKDALRANLKERWLGSYIYYYYCENNQPNQVAKSSSNAGVN